MVTSGINSIIEISVSNILTSSCMPVMRHAHAMLILNPVYTTVDTFQGENIDSVLVDEIRVTVGGVECDIRRGTNVRLSSIFCTVPLLPPAGISPAEINVRVCCCNDTDSSFSFLLGNYW